MPRYITFFSYTREAAAAMIRRPTDRPAAARALVESLGGTMESFYWMHGKHDGFLIASYPDGTSAAALSLAGESTPALVNMQTHEIFDGAAQTTIVAAARNALGAYTPPTGEG